MAALLLLPAALSFTRSCGLLPQVYRNVLDPGLVYEAGRHIEWLQEQNPGRRPEQLGHDLVAQDPFWVRLVSDRRLLAIAAHYIGEDIALFASHYIAKPPGDGQEVLMHQDGSYWPLEPMEVVTLWLAVDDSDVDNGCMKVLPGTVRPTPQEPQIPLCCLPPSPT